MFFIYHPRCPCGRNAPQRDAATIVLDCKDGVNEVSDPVAASLHRHHWEKPKMMLFDFNGKHYRVWLDSQWSKHTETFIPAEGNVFTYCLYRKKGEKMQENTHDIINYTSS